MIEGFIDKFEPIINDNGIIYCEIVIGNNIKVTTEEIIKKISKFRHYYYNGKIKIITNETNEFVLDLIKKINMINLQYEIVNQQ